MLYEVITVCMKTGMTGPATGESMTKQAFEEIAEAGGIGPGKAATVKFKAGVPVRWRPEILSSYNFV